MSPPRAADTGAMQRDDYPRDGMQVPRAIPAKSWAGFAALLAVLARTARQLQSIEATLRRNGIPCRVHRDSGGSGGSIGGGGGGSDFGGGFSSGGGASASF